MDSDAGILGNGGGIVEADETYIGKKPGEHKRRGGYGHKNTVLALVERNGKVRSKHVTNFSEVKDTFTAHMAKDAHVMTTNTRSSRRSARTTRATSGSTTARKNTRGAT